MVAEYGGKVKKGRDCELDLEPTLCLNTRVGCSAMNYPISQLAEKTGLSIHALRYYEKEGVLRRVERTPGGRRVYNEESVSMVIGALCLKQAGMTLPQIKEFYDLTAQGAKTLPQRLGMLRAARENLRQQQELISQHLEFVDFVIDYSKGAIASAREGCDPEDSHPLLTAGGAFRFPCERMPDGRLRPCIPGRTGQQS